MYTMIVYIFEMNFCRERDWGIVMLFQIKNCSERLVNLRIIDVRLICCRYFLACG
jgi:hypothetical protein